MVIPVSILVRLRGPLRWQELSAGLPRVSIISLIESSFGWARILCELRGMGFLALSLCFNDRHIAFGGESGLVETERLILHDFRHDIRVET